MINFLDFQQVSSFILEDQDNYIKNLNKNDIYARTNTYINISDLTIIQQQNYYKQIGLNSLRNFNQKDIQIITNAIEIIQQRLYQLCVNRLERRQFCLYDILNQHNDKFKENTNKFDILTELLYNLEYDWNLALFDSQYENGFPHTRENIIFISIQYLQQDIYSIISVLIHERVHILQRYLKNNNKELLDLIIYEFDFIPLNNIQMLPYIRANPDIDDILYIHKKTGQLSISIYKKNKPEHINKTAIIIEQQQIDQLVTNKELYQKMTQISLFKIKLKNPFTYLLQEHPFEQIAYLYTHYFLKE